MISKTTSILFALFFAAFLPKNGVAQNLKSYERAGDKALAQKDYSAAIYYYGVLLAGDGENLAARWKYAECARQFNAHPEAEKALRKIEAAKRGREKFPLLDFRLGQVLQAQGRYGEAVSSFTNFMAAPGEFPEKETARREIGRCQFAQKLVAAAGASPAVVTHLGKEVNSPYSDFAPVALGDTLFFSSYKFDKKGDTGTPRRKITKMLASVKGGRSREIARFPAADSVHVANGAISADGHFFFYTFCKNLNANDIRCELYLSVKDKRGKWSKPKRLPEGINQSGFTTTHPAIGFDPTTRRTMLWFSSDRPGGLGKLDLWSVPLDSAWFCPCNAQNFGGKKDPPLPKFEAPGNLSDLNTPENDATPFFHTPTRTLYFSTDGRAGLGGYDLFSVQKTSPTAFSKVVANLGAGLNSSYNDLYPFVRRDGRSGYFASNRPGVFFIDEQNKACCNDIFAFQLPAPEKPRGMDSTEIATKIPPSILPPIPPALPETSLPTQPAPVPPPTFEPPQLLDFVGLPLYFDNDEPDKRTRKTITKKTYEATAVAYLERQTEYRDRFSEGLAGERRDAAETHIEDWFEDEVRRGYDRLFQLTDLVFSRLQAGETIEVVIKGFTSPRAQSDYNLNLGKRRISSVRNHFEAWNEGALRAFLQSGVLKISEASFGETTARAGISDDLKDERNSIFSPDAARERRVEIVEIRN